MAKSLGDRLEHAWNALTGKETPTPTFDSYQAQSPQRSRPRVFNSKQIIAPILTQIAVDASGVELRHVRLDKENEVYEENVDSLLNDCLLISPNLDQSPAHFRQDAYMTLLEEGVCAIVPVETTLNPNQTDGYDITQLRVGTVVRWFPEDVQVRLYNQLTGRHQEIILPKKMVAIAESPLYSVLNEPNSTLQRLLAKLNALDITDDRLASGKLDIILQLGYAVKHETRQAEARRRVGDLEAQLSGNKYGIGYIDGTERVTQLNRPAENNLLEQVKSLESRLYAQLGLTEEVFFGTADEAAMLNYYNRTVFPLVRTLQEEMRRKFLTKNARTRGQSIMYFRNPFNLVPVNQLAEIADKFTRNEIMAPNEFRPVVGLRPVKDPEANELRNRNMPRIPEEPPVEKKPKEESPEEEPPPEETENQPRRDPTDEA